MDHTRQGTRIAVWLSMAAVAVTAVVLILLGKITLYHDTSDNRLYLLSTIAQTLGTTLATMTGFALVAVQLGAQFYTPQVIRLLLADTTFKLVVGLNITTITCCLFLLAIGTWEAESFPKYWAEMVILCLAVSCVLSLPLYIRRLFDLLSVDGLVSFFTGEITVRAILESAEASESNQRLAFVLDIPKSRKDCITPLGDLVASLAERRHFDSVSNVLLTLAARISYLHKNQPLNRQGIMCPALSEEEVWTLCVVHLGIHLRRMLGNSTVERDPRPVIYAIKFFLNTLLHIIRTSRLDRALPELLDDVESLAPTYSKTVAEVLSAELQALVTEKQKNSAKNLLSLINILASWLRKSALLSVVRGQLQELQLDSGSATKPVLTECLRLLDDPVSTAPR